MSSPAAAGDVLPALPPIKTAAAVAAPAPSWALTSTAPDAETLPAGAKEEAEPTTPMSEESKLRPPTECPPAPRKPAYTTLAKRKSPSPSSSSPPPASASARRVFFAVPRDLSAVFRPLPPKKRIRAG